MGKIIVNLPDDGWIDSCAEIKPGYGELCLCISSYWEIPRFCQYRKADYLHRESNYFLVLDELFLLTGQGAIYDWVPTFMKSVEKWKPLTLPESSQDSVMELIGRVIERE